MITKSSRILVFIDGPMPTEADMTLARKFGTFMFRNAQEGVSSGLENCDGVIGGANIPAAYAAAFPVLDKEQAPTSKPSTPSPAPPPATTPTDAPWK